MYKKAEHEGSAQLIAQQMFQ